MNDKDRKRLERLSKILDGVPLPASGSQSTTIRGMIGFSWDMRAVRAPVREVLKGMCLEGHEEAEPGWDYYDPDLILEGLEMWLGARNCAGWEHSNPHSFDRYWEKIKEMCDPERSKT